MVARIAVYLDLTSSADASEVLLSLKKVLKLPLKVVSSSFKGDNPTKNTESSEGEIRP